MSGVAILHPHGGMGDLILSYPVISAFAEAFPNQPIIYATPPGMEDVVRAHPAVAEAVPLDSGIPAALKLAGVLRKKQIKIGCALWTTARAAWLLALSGAPIRIGQGGRMLSSFLFTRRVNVRSARGDTQSHWVECLLDYPRTVGAEPRDKTIAISPTAEGLQAAKRLLRELGASLDSPVVVIHPGKGEKVLERGWPAALFAHIGDELANRGFTVVFTGGRGEVQLADRILAGMKAPGYSAAGKTNFETLAALLSFSKVLICPDSGPMHLAAAVKTPVVAIFAMEKDFPKRWAPWEVEQRIIRPESFPCRQWCTKETCPDFLCYNALEPKPIVRAALELMEKTERKVIQ